jgi:hypothetical protein
MPPRANKTRGGKVAQASKQLRNGTAPVSFASVVDSAALLWIFPGLHLHEIGALRHTCRSMRARVRQCGTLCDIPVSKLPPVTVYNMEEFARVWPYSIGVRLDGDGWDAKTFRRCKLFRVYVHMRALLARHPVRGML